jgi:S-DNA-T family DNA segregation ATPase FtsK/SpoIIIE
MGYFILPLTMFFVAGVFLTSRKQNFVGITFIGAGLLILSGLGIIDIVQAGAGGWLGKILGSFKSPFSPTGAFIINVVIAGISAVVISNTPIRLSLPQRKQKEEEDEKLEDHIEVKEMKPAPGQKEDPGKEQGKGAKEEEEEAEEEEDIKIVSRMEEEKGKKKSPVLAAKFANYVPPPLSLLKSSVEKPTTGDLRANANIIKRTLESFGINVEMGEINIGPKVTRYTLKPAEGMKLSRITALSPDLALALAAHPIRIEAPIPGKSLVGIEVPNKAAAMVRLGNLVTYPEFASSGSLGISMGRDVNGDPIFSSIEKMPHMLVAGATGSGKSIFVHSLLISLLYKNSPSALKLVMIDPKRVELSMYDGLPHLVMPVITDNKKALGVFRWAIKEMERRYELLSSMGRRDIQSYNSKNPEEPLPWIVIVVDEMADLMTQYGREVEGSIIRLAQMARATGIHLVLSTQRPSVEVITGLIKANITNRIALQVASQIDSRTILDTSGAEKLLGGGDLLYISPSLSKPKRIQGAYISEDEISNVTQFIRENNKPQGNGGEQIDLAEEGKIAIPNEVLDEYLEDGEDELYDEAVEVVASAKKASASLLQRRLKVGYARAARLLDLMEANGIIGPGEGAKPREVFLDRLPEQTQ